MSISWITFTASWFVFFATLLPNKSIHCHTNQSDLLKINVRSCPIACVKPFKVLNLDLREIPNYLTWPITPYHQTPAYTSISFLLYNTVSSHYFSIPQIYQILSHMRSFTLALPCSLSMTYPLSAWFSLTCTSDLTVFVTFSQAFPDNTIQKHLVLFL